MDASLGDLSGSTAVLAAPPPPPPQSKSVRELLRAGCFKKCGIEQERLQRRRCQPEERQWPSHHHERHRQYQRHCHFLAGTIAVQWERQRLVRVRRGTG